MGWDAPMKSKPLSFRVMSVLCAQGHAYETYTPQIHKPHHEPPSPPPALSFHRGSPEDTYEKMIPFLIRRERPILRDEIAERGGLTAEVPVVGGPFRYWGGGVFRV